MSSQGSLPSFPSDADGDTAFTEDHYAPWGRRALGFVVDWLIVILVATLVTKAVGAHTIYSSISTAHNAKGHKAVQLLSTRFLVATAIIAAVTFLYAFAFLASSWQATIGMRLSSLRIARAADDGPVSVGLSAWRSAIFMVEQMLFTFLSIVGILGYLADMLWPLWDSRRQTLHDKLARTVVLPRAKAP